MAMVITPVDSLLSPGATFSIVGHSTTWAATATFGHQVRSAVGTPGTGTCATILIMWADILPIGRMGSQSAA